eukprot:3409160-Karenia_brevis.AAC.1
MEVLIVCATLSNAEQLSISSNAAIKCLTTSGRSGVGQSMMLTHPSSPAVWWAQSCDEIQHASLICGYDLQHWLLCHPFYPQP